MSKVNGIPDDMQGRIGIFSTKAGALVERLVKRSNKERRPTIISNDAGLMGIIEKGELWLTNASYLNDPSELEHGIEPALQRIESASRAHRDEFALFVGPLRRALRENLSRIGHFFICSFSREHDDLGQWRAYGDNARGYAIGFNARALEGAFNARPGGHSQSFPMVYSEKDLRSLQVRIVELALPLVSAPHGRALTGRVIGRYMGQVAVAVAQQIVMAAILFKHAAYKNESEIRLLEIHSVGEVPGLKHRSRGYRRVPYKVFDRHDVAPRALEKIVIGPAADADHARRFADDCLRAGGIDVASGMIKKSMIPYRA